MMAYESKYPTSKKKRMYSFMEKHKKHGVVGFKKFKEYLHRENLKPKYEGSSKTVSSGYGKKSDMYWYTIKGDRGTVVADVGIKNKKSPQIVWWRIK
jgi:hypothetical protein